MNAHYCDQHKQYYSYPRALCSNCGWSSSSFDVVMSPEDQKIANDRLYEEHKEFFEEIKRQWEELIQTG